MSTMALNLPMNYVEVDRDEMEYVDGGFSVSTQWYGVRASFTEYETQLIVKTLNAGAGISAVVGTLAAMGVVTAIGSGPAYLLSAGLWAASAIIDVIDYAGGSDGINIKVLWNGTPTVWSN
ncbi:MAG: hypothetical protein AB6733_20585 [Clostridiaceae bacterium]